MMAFRNRNEAGRAELDRAIAGWRSGRGEESLTETARARILGQARRAASRAERGEPFAPLFLPLSRLALGAAMPVAALSLALVTALALQGDLVPTAPPAAKTHTRVDVSKSGGDIVFVIHNGPGLHTIARSIDPGSFDAEPIVRTASGRFRDRLTGDPSIVYYRID